jgi:signal peptidase I
VIEEEQPTHRAALWREILILMGVAAVVALVVRVFLLQTFWIPSGSMENTLEVNDRVVANKVVYHFRDPDRGEIVVFQPPEQWRSASGDAFIKRIIGVGGDTIVCCDEAERLVINGLSLDESYLYENNGVTDSAADTEFEVVVPEGRLWVMGDHRSWSGDSLDQYRASDGDLVAATVNENDVIGRAFVRFWPVGRAGLLSIPEEYDAVPDR